MSWLCSVKYFTDVANNNTTNTQFFSNPWVVGVGVALISWLIIWLISSTVKYFSDKKNVHEENNSLKVAHEKATSLLKKILSSPDEQHILKYKIIETLIINEFKECKISSASIINKLPDIISDLIAELYRNEYISEIERTRIVHRALTMLKSCQVKADLRESLKRWKEVSIPASILSVIYAVAGGLLAFFVVMAIYLHIITALGQQPGPQFGQVYWFSLLAIVEIAILTVIRSARQRRKASKPLINAIEAEVLQLIGCTYHPFQIERNKSLLVGNGWIQADLVMDFDGMKLPIAVFSSSIKQTDIERLEHIMKGLYVQKSLMVTSSKASKNMRILAEARNIAVVDNVISEKDISDRISFVKFFNV